MPRRTSRYSLDTFLRQLARTGNFALSADRAGLAKSGLYKRRARDGEFDKVCREALAAFRSSPERAAARRHAPSMAERLLGPPKAVEGAQFLTAPGDLVLTRGQSRPAQLRRAPAGRLTQTGIAAFLKTLARTANVRLAAASVGVAHSSIYRRRRADPGFAEAMRKALTIGYDRVDAALLESAHRALDPDPEHEAWLQANGGAAMEPMTFDQALMLFTLHCRQVRDGWDGFHRPWGGLRAKRKWSGR